MGEEVGSVFKIFYRDEFVFGVGLVDRAGAEADGGEAESVEVSGIGEPRGTDEGHVGMDGLEALEPRVINGSVHGGRFGEVGDF